MTDIQEKTDRKFIRAAIKESLKSLVSGDVPVGCVIADENDKIIARAHNEREKTGDSTGSRRNSRHSQSLEKTGQMESYRLHLVRYARAVRYVFGSRGKRKDIPHSFRRVRQAVWLLRHGLQSCLRPKIQSQMRGYGRRKRGGMPRRGAKFFQKAEKVEKKRKRAVKFLTKTELNYIIKKLWIVVKA